MLWAAYGSLRWSELVALRLDRLGSSAPPGWKAVAGRGLPRWRGRSHQSILRSLLLARAEAQRTVPRSEMRCSKQSGPRPLTKWSAGAPSKVPVHLLRYTDSMFPLPFCAAPKASTPPRFETASFRKPRKSERTSAIGRLQTRIAGLRLRADGRRQSWPCETRSRSRRLIAG